MLQSSSAMTDDRLAAIEQHLAHLLAGQEQLRAGQDELRAGQDELRAGQIVLITRVDKLEIGQENLRDDLKALADGQRALQIEIRQGLADLREDIGRRLDPLEIAVRNLEM